MRLYLAELRFLPDTIVDWVFVSVAEYICFIHPLLKRVQGKAILVKKLDGNNTRTTNWLL
jgi:hypothetical protein